MVARSTGPEIAMRSVNRGRLDIETQLSKRKNLAVDEGLGPHRQSAGDVEDPLHDPPGLKRIKPKEDGRTRGKIESESTFDAALKSLEKKRFLILIPLPFPTGRRQARQPLGQCSSQDGMPFGIGVRIDEAQSQVQLIRPQEFIEGGRHWKSPLGSLRLHKFIDRKVGVLIIQFIQVRVT